MTNQQQKMNYALLGITLLSVLVLPAYIALYLSPAISDFLADITEREAVRVARQLAALLVPDQGKITRESLPVNFAHNAAQAQDQFLLKNIKLFSAAGEVLYSNDRGDIGKINHHSYFHNIVARGENFSKLVAKDRKSMEGRVMSAHVVETYVPIMRHGQFAGAFEIYYDITARRQRMTDLLHHFYLTLAVIVGGLLVVVLFTSRKVGLYNQARCQAEGRLRQLNESLERQVVERTRELQTALEEVRTLHGLLPVCRSCRKIRDSHGGWQEICAYIEAHSEAECTYDLCPECEQRITQNESTP